jgi:phage baseplate assembly protein W
MASQPSILQRLGSDLKFPIVGNFETVTGLDTLIQDIQQLLLTAPGERVSRPSFGCNLRNMVWENIDSVAVNGPAEIKAAITNYEPRVTVTEVTSTINRNTSLIVFNIKFFVKNTDTALNLVFPFRVGSSLSA